MNTFVALGADCAEIKSQLPQEIVLPATQPDQGGKKMPVDDDMPTLRKKLKKAPKDPILWDALGEAFSQAEQLPAAKEAFSKAAALAPGECRLWVKLALVQRALALNQIAEAEESLNRALRINPNHEMALLQLALNLMSRRQFEEARRLFWRIEKFNPKNVEALLLGAHCQFEVGDPIAARLNYLRVLKLDPQNAEAKKRLAALQVMPPAPPPSKLAKDIKTAKRFSPVTLSFPSGLLGFKQYTQFVLNGHPEENPFFRLSASDKPGVQFVLAPPEAIGAGYHPSISDADVKILGLTDPADAMIFNLVTPMLNGQGAINLLSPIVVNRKTLQAKQVSLANVAQYTEDRVLPPEAAFPLNFWTCQEMHKVQQRLDGRVRACCMLPDLHWAAGESLQNKRELNENLACGNFGPCTGCAFLHTTGERPNVHPNMIDIFTNSFCSVRCWYCEYTKPGGLQDAPAELREDCCGVEQRILNTQDIPAFIRKFAADAGGNLKTISLSGGDSAYHPQFREIVRTAAECGVKVVYLSAGVLPPQIEDFCIKEIQAGRMFLSISPDASKSETWAKIKRRPATFWDRVVSFVSKAAQANKDGVVVKMILMRENVVEVGDFIRCWHQQGVRRFAVSALFGNADKQLTREEYTKASQTARAAIENLERKYGVKLHLETIAL
jgi:flagellar assembly factor FliW/cytochrome c-type biogenesis protein CcmH/NrfG/molybdenum cofactor biosynthesis enzyme MoaA